MERDGVFDYEDLFLNLLPKATPGFDLQAEVTLNLGKNKGLGCMSYEDRESICEKAGYVNGSELGGLAVWELSGDLEDHPESLVNAMYCGMNPTIPGCESTCLE